MKNKQFRWDLLAICGLVGLSVFLILNVNYVMGVGGVDGDIGDGFYAIVSSNAQYLVNGEFPLWNTTLFSGFTNAGFLYQMFYPILQILLLVFFDKEAGILSYNIVEAYYIVHFIILSIGLYFLTRQITKNKIICFSISALAIFSGSIMTVFHWFAILSGHTYIPYLIGFFILMSKSDGKKSWIYTIGVGISIGLTGISGTSHGLLIIILIFSFLYFAYIWSIRSDKSKVINATLKCLTGGFIGIGFCAVQLLPMIEYMSLAFRFGLGTDINTAVSKLTLSDFTVHSVGIDGLKDIFKSVKGYFSLGIPLALTTIVGFFTKTETNKYILNFAKFTFIFTLFMSMSVFFNDMVWYIPYLSSMRESYIYVIMFAISSGIIACFGMVSITEYLKNKNNIFSDNNTLGLILILTFIFILLPHNFQNLNKTIIILSVLAAILIFLKVKIDKQKILSVLLLICVFINVSSVRASIRGGDYTGSTVSNAISEVSGTYKNWINQVGAPTTEDPYRVTQWGNFPVYPKNLFVSMGINDGFGNANPIYKRNFEVYLNFPIDKRSTIQNIKYIMQTTEDSENWLSQYPGFQEVGALNDMPSDWLNTTQADIRVFENTKRQGGAWMVYNMIPYGDETTISEFAPIAHSPQFTPENMAFVNVDKEPLIYESTKGNISNVDITEYKANSMKLKVENDNAGLLVTAEQYYPGWKVYVDGNKATVSEVNYAYRGVWLEPGDHIVEFKFMPPLFVFGLFLALLSLGTCVAIVAIYFKDPKNKLLKKQ